MAGPAERSSSAIPRFAEAFAGLGSDLSTLLRRLADTGERDELSAAALRPLWRACVRDARAGRVPALFGCYLHIPFCRSRCAYCRHFKERLESPAQLARYLGVLKRAIAYFGPAFAGVKFANLIVGGGTPGLIEPDALDDLLATVLDTFAFDEERGDRAFEFNPAGVTPQKVAVLKKHGFRRVSMGVQSLRLPVLEAQRRGYQTAGVVARAFQAVRDAGIPQLCADLIAGLEGDTPAGFEESVAALARLGPDQITVYPLSPTRPYVEERFGGDFQAFLERRAQFLAEVLPWMRESVGRLGYRDEGQRFDPRDNCWMFDRGPGHGPPGDDQDGFYDEASPVPASILGLGPGANSMICGRLEYSDCGPVPGRFEPRERRYWAVRRDRRSETRRFVLMSLRKRGLVPRDHFRRYFGTDLAEEHAAAVATLVERGLARLTEESLLLRPEADRFQCAVPFLDAADLERALGAEEPRRAVRLASRSYAAELVVEHARRDESYVEVRRGLGLRLVWAEARPGGAARDTSSAAPLVRLAGQAFREAGRGARDPGPAAMARALLVGLRWRAARRGFRCEPVGGREAGS